MSSFSEAVKEWNERAKEDGWRSSFAPQMPCSQCKNVGMMLTTIHGLTKASCECGYSWVLA